MNNIRGYITTAVLVFTMYLLITLFTLNIPSENKDLVNITLGAVIGWVSTIISFYFGSTDKQKGDV